MCAQPVVRKIKAYKPADKLCRLIYLYAAAYAHAFAMRAPDTDKNGQPTST